MRLLVQNLSRRSSLNQLALGDGDLEILPSELEIGRTPFHHGLLRHTIPIADGQIAFVTKQFQVFYTLSRLLPIAVTLNDLPTGTGKTPIFADPIFKIFRKSEMSLFCVYRHFRFGGSSPVSLVQSPRRAFRGNERKRGEWHRVRGGLLNKRW